MICVVPEIKIQKMTKGNEFLVIACDGIWDCLTSQECVNITREYLQSSQSKGDHSTCLEQMFDKIIANDVASSGGIGCDNMTAIIVQLKQ